MHDNSAFLLRVLKAWTWKWTVDSSGGVAGVLGALEEFTECVRYLDNRRSEGPILSLDSESAVQDAVYLMLRPWIRDLIPESPLEKTANSYAIPDFTSRASRLIVEVKFIRDRAHGKTISKELHHDIETYRQSSYYDNILFFIYDAGRHIPDGRALRGTIEQSRIYDGRPLSCKVIIKP